MNSAQDLYDKLISFKQASDSQSPEQQLLEYCNQTLGTVERTHFDYKQKHDRSNSIPHNDDKNNLAKAVSGFANTGGGVLIWGIENNTLRPKAIADIQNFTSELLKLAAHVTDPPVPGIDGDWIPSSDVTSQNGFGLILIPESPLPPHRVILKRKGIKDHYYIRTGESFVIASHTILEDMFGRRPKPQLTLSTRPEMQDPNIPRLGLDIIIGIENQGRGTANAPYLLLQIVAPYNIQRYELDGNGRPGLNKIPTAPRLNEHLYGGLTTITIPSGVVHEVTRIRVELDEDLNMPPDLILKYKIAAEGVQLIENQKRLTGRELRQMAQDLIKSGDHSKVR